MPRFTSDDSSNLFSLPCANFPSSRTSGFKVWSCCATLIRNRIRPDTWFRSYRLSCTPTIIRIHHSRHSLLLLLIVDELLLYFVLENCGQPWSSCKRFRYNSFEFDLCETKVSKLIDLIYFQISNQYLIQFPIGFSRLWKEIVGG